ncbi:MAG: FtsQ-type POTRA domain-containing protein [Scytonematopsis contorta HA4267-MV1]|jgi:cell division protein FtsQ|nr:FtsQ-type POTRA domain-containing protein [Scytonematopsis contorta HA4267-MV1]
MAGIVSLSRTDLESRRKKLRHKRLLKVIQTIWRGVALSGLAGSLLWVAIQPIWVLSDPTKQIMITGNKLLTDKGIQSLLLQYNPTLSSPQSLLRIDPTTIAKSLNRQEIIAQARVSRSLFPPGLIVQVVERKPVAIAQKISPDAETASNRVSLGLLDANGVLMPFEKYKLLKPSVEAPTLKVIGSPEKYRLYWNQVYEAVSHSRLKITEIDWQDPTNLILNTELGKVHIGSVSSQLPEQINVMAQLQHLPKKVNFNQIDFIDLRNPSNPLVRMNHENQKK